MFQVYDSSSSPRVKQQYTPNRRWKGKKSMRNSLLVFDGYSWIPEYFQLSMVTSNIWFNYKYEKPFCDIWNHFELRHPWHFGQKKFILIFIHFLHIANTCDDCYYFQSMNCFSIFPYMAECNGLLLSESFIPMEKQTQTRCDNNNNFQSMRVLFYLLGKGGYLFVFAPCVGRICNENVTMHLNVQQNRCLPISVLFVCKWVALVSTLFSTCFSRPARTASRCCFSLLFFPHFSFVKWEEKPMLGQNINEID